MTDVCLCVMKVPYVGPSRKSVSAPSTIHSPPGTWPWSALYNSQGAPLSACILHLQYNSFWTRTGAAPETQQRNAFLHSQTEQNKHPLDSGEKLRFYHVLYALKSICANTPKHYSSSAFNETERGAVECKNIMFHFASINREPLYNQALVYRRLSKTTLGTFPPSPGGFLHGYGNA